MERHTGPWAGSGCGGEAFEAFEAFGRVSEGWGGIRGHGRTRGVVGRPTGTWAGTESGGEAYGAMSMQMETLEDMRGHELSEDDN